MNEFSKQALQTIIVRLAASLMKLTFKEDLWWENFDRLRSIPQMIGGGVVQHRLRVSLQYRVLLGRLSLHRILGMEFSG